jgi:hypothetical protein
MISHNYKISVTQIAFILVFILLSRDYYMLNFYLLIISYIW